MYVTLPWGIAKFDSAGTWVCDYTGDNGYATGAGYGLDVENTHGTVFLAEPNLNRIVMLRPVADGLSGSVYEWKTMIGRNGGDGSPGQGNGEFNFPMDVAVDGDHLYVADKKNHRIQKFAIDYAANTLTWEASWGKNDGDGTAGSGDGEFTEPMSIAADHSGSLYVADYGNHRIQKLTTSGDFVTKWGVSTPASDPLYMSDLVGIDVDGGGNVYVTDFSTATSWVNKYKPVAGGTFELASRLGGWGTGDAQFGFPWSCAVDPDGYLYVTDTQNNRIKKFARDASAPTVTPLGFPSGWAKAMVGHPELSATDPVVAGQYASGGVRIYYSKTGGAPWTEYLEPFAASDFTEGDNAVTYYASDAVGNESTPATAHVRLDWHRPLPKALADRTVRKSRWVSLPYRVNDGASPQAKVRIRIYKGTTLKKSITLSAKKTNAGLRYSFRCGLPKGRYRWKVYATDLAGNVQAKPGVRTLIVK